MSLRALALHAHWDRSVGQDTLFISINQRSDISNAGNGDVPGQKPSLYLARLNYLLSSVSW